MHLGKDRKTRQSDESSAKPWKVSGHSVSFRLLLAETKADCSSGSSSEGRPGRQREKPFLLPREPHWGRATKRKECPSESYGCVYHTSMAVGSCQDSLLTGRASAALLTPLSPLSRSLKGELGSGHPQPGWRVNCSVKHPGFLHSFYSQIHHNVSYYRHLNLLAITLSEMAER